MSPDIISTARSGVIVVHRLTYGGAKHTILLRACQASAEERCFYLAKARVHHKDFCVKEINSNVRDTVMRERDRDETKHKDPFAQEINNNMLCTEW